MWEAGGGKPVASDPPRVLSVDVGTPHPNLPLVSMSPGVSPARRGAAISKFYSATSFF